MIIEILLLGVIVVLIGERYFYAREMNEQVRDNFRALLSRDSNDYIAMRAQDKKPTVKHEVPPDAPLESVSDIDFMKAIKEELTNG